MGAEDPRFVGPRSAASRSAASRSAASRSAASRRVVRQFEEAARQFDGTLVVGTGRCGTGYVSRVCRGGHEAVFGLDGRTAVPRKRCGKMLGPLEASWLAMPFGGLVSGRTVLLVRDKAATVRSLGMPVHGNYNWYIHEILGRDAVLGPEFYDVWTPATFGWVPDMIVDIDFVTYGPLEEVEEIFGCKVWRDVPANYNSRT